MTLDESLLDALLSIKATSDTVKSLLSYFRSAPTTSARGPSNVVEFSFVEQIQDLNLLEVQLEQLRSKLVGLTNLLSSFLDLGSGFAMQVLARESSKENEEMRKLSESMHELTKTSVQDAAAIKVLTTMTLIYLPTTVVSNFFLTSFVGKDLSPQGSGQIIVYSDWWIFAAVSVPLTFVTLYVWWATAYKTYPWWWKNWRLGKSAPPIVQDYGGYNNEKV